MINLGVIGFGGISKYLHIPQSLESGSFSVKAVADVQPDNGEAAALGIPSYYTDCRRLLSDPEIDAVVVATPHNAHLEHCKATFEAGKHVLVEKPIARYLWEAEAILEAADKAGTTFMLGFCERFYPEHQYIKSLLDQNTLGTPLSARIDHYQNFSPAPDSWWRKQDMVSGGCVIGSGFHRLDLLRWYFGEPVSVFAKAVPMVERLEAEACCYAVITFDSGVIANFSCNWAIYQYPYYEGLSITGRDGTLLLRNFDLLLGLRHLEAGEMRPITPPAGETMYAHFADCIRNGKTPLTDGMEGYKTLQLVRAIYQSMETGLVVDPSTIVD